jgi:hypothetical protein
MIFVATTNGKTKKFPPSSFGAVVGSGIRVPRFEIRDPRSGMDKKSESGIRDKHPGSATLL